MMRESADVLLAFGERAVGRLQVAALEPHDGRRAAAGAGRRANTHAPAAFISSMQRRDVPHDLVQLMAAAEARRRVDKC